MSASETLIRLRGVSKVHQRGAQAVPVLEQIDLDVPAGAFEAIMGPSGSGKITLLNLISGIDRCSQGQLEVGGLELTRRSEDELASPPSEARACPSSKPCAPVESRCNGDG